LAPLKGGLPLQQRSVMLLTPSCRQADKRPPSLDLKCDQRAGRSLRIALHVLCRTKNVLALPIQVLKIFAPSLPLRSVR
jgi:hypothetical protein